MPQDNLMIEKPEDDLNPQIMGMAQFGFSTDSEILKIGNGVDSWQDRPAIGEGGPVTPPEYPGGPHYEFSTELSASGITAGQIRVNNATAASITEVYVAQQDSDGNNRGPDLALFSAGGYLVQSLVSDDTVISTFAFTSCIDNGDYFILYGRYLSGALPGDGLAVRLLFSPSEVTGVQRYVAKLNQSSTDAPVASVKENGLIDTSWTYSDSGTYIFNFASAELGRTFVFINNGSGGTPTFVQHSVIDGFGVVVYSMDSALSLTDGILVNASFMVMHYA